MDWLILLAVQGTPKSLLQHHSLKASILQHSAFFIVQLSHPYMITGKTIALTRQTFVGKVMCLVLNMLSGLVIAFLSRVKRLLISCLQSVILEAAPPKKNQPLFPLFPHLFAIEVQWMTFILGGSKITANGGCSHEIKRCLLLGRKVVTNLESMLKSRDIACQQRSI